MKKLTLSILSLCLLSACAGTSNGAIQGTVTAIDLEGVMVDGPAILTIELADESTKEIRVPSMGRNLCKATELADVYQIQVGDEVEVLGAEDEEGSIIPCESEEHFLRVL